MITGSNNQEELRWAIVGPGEIAHHFIEDMQYVRAFRNKVVSVMSDKRSEAEAFANEYHISKYYDNITKMVEEDPPDIVYVASPHASHFKETLICLQHRIPVLCEKPLTLNTGQAAILTQTARENHTFLMEGMWIRFLPHFKLITGLLSNNTIGPVHSVTADMSYRAPVKNNRFYNPSLGGGSLLDLGIYPVYLAVLLLGIPDQIKATALLSEKGIDESCAALLEYNEKPAYAMIESSIIKDTSRQADIFGRNGKIHIKEPWNEKSAGVIVSLYDANVTEYPLYWEGRGFQYEIMEVGDCLLNGLIESPLHSHAQTLNTLRVMDDIRMKTGIIYPLEP